MRAVHQFVPMLHRRDAVGNHTRALRRALVARGVASEIFVETVDPETAGETRHFSQFEETARGDRDREPPGTGREDAATVFVYQLATASGLAPWLAGRPEPLVVNYHNVTPPACFAPWDQGLAAHQERALADVALLAGRAQLAVAVSEFNRTGLVAAGYRRTAVVPPAVTLLGPDPLVTGPAETARATYPERRARWLAVGRLVPNKAFEDVLAALAQYRRHFDPKATLTVVGQAALPSYAGALRRKVGELRLRRAVRFEAGLSDDELRQRYDRADLLVVASDHEGFCLPVVEAMAHDLPVLAYRAGALPEVLGHAGLSVAAKDPATLAAAAWRLVAEPGLATELASAGRRRLGELDLGSAADRLAEVVLAELP